MYVPKHARHGHKLNQVQEQMKHQIENFAILVKKSSQSGQRDVKITLSSEETQYKVVDITLTPSSNQARAKVTVDGKEIQISENKSFQYGQGYIQLYVLPNGEVKAEVRNQFYILYDGQRVSLTILNDKFRDSNRGICGQFNNIRTEELFTPKNCFARDYQKFVRSYEVEGSDGDEIRNEMQSNPKQCIRKTSPIYIDVIRSSTEEELSGGVSEQCNKFQTRYVQREGEICFTLRPMPVCGLGCQSTATSDRNVAVHCIRESSVSQLWKKQIDNGGSPDFSHKSESRTESLQIPQNCS